MDRRHLTTTVTMLVLVGLLVLGATWGWKSLFADLPETGTTAATPTPTCKPEKVEPGQKITAKQVRVSVFNGGSRSGLAGQTLDKLAERGFLTGDVGNAPSDIEVKRVQVWSTTRHDDQARLVARQFGKDVKVRHSNQDLGAGVDVIVGDDFKRLVKAPHAITVKRPQRFCEPLTSTAPED